MIYTPQDRLYNESLKRGELLLWDPTAFGGHPFQAIGHPSVLYPPRILAHLLLPSLAAREVLLFLHLYLNGLFMYAFLRSLARSRFASLVGATAWMLGGYAIVYLEFEFVTLACAYIPLGLFFVERLQATGSPRQAAGLGLATGFLILTGHWQYVVYALVTIGGYAAWRCAQGRNPRTAALTAAGLALGLGAGAVQILPSLELVQLSHRPVRTLEELYSGSRFLPENLLTLLVPDALGHPRHHFYLTPIQSGVQTYMDLCAYMGTATLFLALAGIQRRTLFFSLLSGAALGYAMGLPGSALFYHLLPGFKSFAPSRVLLIFCFGAAVLAAHGADRPLPRRFTAAALSMLLLALLGLSLFSLKLQDPAFMQAFVMRFAPVLMALPNYCEDSAFWADTLVRSILDHYDPLQPTLLLPLVLGAAGLAALHLRRPGWKQVVLLTLAADLLFFGMRFSPTFPATSAMAPAPGLEALARSDGQPHRVGGLSQPVHPNLLTAYGLHDLAGYGSLFPGRVARLMEALSRHEQSYLMADLWDAEGLTPAMARFLNLKFLYTDPLHRVPDWAGPPVYDADLRIHQVPGALPRYFVVHRSQVEPDDERTLAALLDPAFAPERAAWLAEGPALDGTGRGTARVLHYGNNRVDIEAETDAPGLLVGSDTWYPGWEATVDGRPAPVLRANYTFRAIPLPPGRHRVELVFRPRPLRIGAWISAGCVLALILMGMKKPRP